MKALLLLYAVMSDMDDEYPMIMHAGQCALSIPADDQQNVLSKVTTPKKRRMQGSGSLLHLVGLNMLVCGIEFCASAGFTYIPPMLLKAGFQEASMTCVMGVGPFLALLTVPALGQWSDRCQSRWGRRRPLIFGISLLIIASLILVAFGQRIGAHLAPGVMLGRVLLVVGVVFLDYGCHAGFNPCEALVADMMKYSSNKEKGFTIYSNMISFGGCIGYLITAMDWSHSSLGSLFDCQEQTAFTFILLLYVAAALTTLLVANERLLGTSRILKSSLGGDGRLQLESMGRTSHAFPSHMPTESNCDDVGYETGSNDSQEDLPTSVSSRNLLFITSDSVTTKVPSDGSWVPASSTTLNVMSVVANILSGRFFLLALRTVCRKLMRWPFLALQVPRRTAEFLFRVVHQLLNVPSVLRLLFLSDFCSWTALMCHNMFYTDYVGQAVYGGNPNADDASPSKALYDSGVRMGSWGLLLHSVTSILYATLLQKKLMEWYGTRTTYIVGLAVFTLCMVGTLLSNNLALINILAALSGTGFAAITTIPYMLVTAYHSDKELYFANGSNLCAINNRERLERNADELLLAHNGHDVKAGVKVDDGIDTEEIKNDDDEDEEEEVEEESRGFGADIAVLDAAYFLSQILLSLFVGSIVDLTCSVTAYIIISAVFGLMACYCATRVVFPSTLS